MAVKVTQEDDSDWVEFSTSPTTTSMTTTTSGGSPAAAAERVAVPYCCVFTTNLHTTGLPEILAVDCESEAARETVEQIMKYVANWMYNSQIKSVPHLFRFTLQMDNDPSPPSLLINKSYYFAVLQVKDPIQIKTLREKYMMMSGEDLVASSTWMSSSSSSSELDSTTPKEQEQQDMVLLLMPIVPRSTSQSSSMMMKKKKTKTKNDGGPLLWSQLPPAPSNNLRMRDHIKQVLEDQHSSPCGFLRILGGEGGSGGGGEKNNNKKKKKTMIAPAGVDVGDGDTKDPQGARHFNDNKKKKQRRRSKRKRDNTNTNHDDDKVVVKRVKLTDALCHPEWKIEWDENLKDHEIKYMKKNWKHFLDLSIDGGIPLKERAIKYIDDVVNNGNEWPKLYEEGKLIETTTSCSSSMTMADIDAEPFM